MDPETGEEWTTEQVVLIAADVTKRKLAKRFEQLLRSQKYYVPKQTVLMNKARVGFARSSQQVFKEININPSTPVDLRLLYTRIQRWMC